jgi:hypothetical protein
LSSSNFAGVSRSTATPAKIGMAFSQSCAKHMGLGGLFRRDSDLSYRADD